MTSGQSPRPAAARARTTGVASCAVSAGAGVTDGSDRSASADTGAGIGAIVDAGMRSKSLPVGKLDGSAIAGAVDALAAMGETGSGLEMRALPTIVREMNPAN